MLLRFLAATLTIGRRHCRLVGSSGVEPPTSCLSGMRSNLLSYEPLLLTQPRSTFDLRFKSYEPLRFFQPMVEMKGFEPLTPCLQGRCSPNWATPPYLRFPTVPGNRTTTFWRPNRVYVVFLFLCELREIIFQFLMSSIERRWSSRTFRYGYLVTT